MKANSSKGRGPVVLTGRKTGRSIDPSMTDFLKSVNGRLAMKAGLDLDLGRDIGLQFWGDQPDVSVNEGSKPGIYAVNSSLLDQGNYTQELTTYITGWRETTNLKQLCDFVAPEVVVPGPIFEYKQWTNAEFLLSDDANDDLYSLEGGVPTVPYTISNQFAKTARRGLKAILDVEEVSRIPGWQKIWAERLVTRLDRNRYRRAIALLIASASASSVVWQPEANAVPLTISGTSGQSSLTVTSAAGLYTGVTIAGVGIPADTRIIAISGTTIYLSAALTASPSSANAVAMVPSQPDGYIRELCRTAGDASGVRPNRILYGRPAFDARLSTHEASNSAGAFGAVARDLKRLADYLGVDEVVVDEARYQSGANTKSEIVGNNVFLFNGLATPTEEDFSNLKTFVSPVPNLPGMPGEDVTGLPEMPTGGQLCVFTRYLSRYLVEIEVSRREVLVPVSTLGVQQVEVTGS